MDPKARSAYIEHLEADIARTRESLAPLEGGQMHIQQRRDGEAWRDVTAETIERHRQNIRTLQSIIAALRKGELP